MITTKAKRSTHRWGDVSGHRHRHSPHDAAWFLDSHRSECKRFGKDFSLSYGSVLSKAIKQFPTIAMDHQVLCGTPRIKGTRVPVYMVVDAVQHYGSVEGARKSYPDLTDEQVKEALLFASAVLEQPIEHEP